MCNIILENDLFRLEIGQDSRPLSLLVKATGEETLMQGEEISLFSVTQERPFNNEVKLAHPNKRTTFQSNRVRLDGDKLIVGFEITPFEAVIAVRVEPKRVRFVVARENAAPKLVLVEGLKGGRPSLHVQPMLITHDAQGNFTKEMRRIYGETE